MAAAHTSHRVGIGQEKTQREKVVACRFVLTTHWLCKDNGEYQVLHAL